MAPTLTITVSGCGIMSISTNEPLVLRDIVVIDYDIGDANFIDNKIVVQSDGSVVEANVTHWGLTDTSVTVIDDEIYCNSCAPQKNPLLE
jgi:hypothetical protein